MKDNIISVLSEKSDLIAGKGVSITEIEKAEQILNIKFADEYKIYLQNFGMVMFKGHEITGIGGDERLDVVNSTLRIKSYFKNIPTDFYLIEDMNIDYIYIWQNGKGHIFSTIADSMPKELCDSLATYFGDICKE